LTGIAGIEKPRATKEVENMLKRLQHRGTDGMEVYEQDHATLGVVWSESEEKLVRKMREQGYVCDTSARGHFARAETKNGNLTLLRDKIGVMPLYYGKTTEGDLCFASEVKALLPVTKQVNELNPASYYDGDEIRNYDSLGVKQPVDWGVEEIAMELRDTLVDAVKMSIGNRTSVGTWLSGGLDSSIISSIAGQHLDELRTYSIGVKDSKYLTVARRVAEYIKSNHKEILVTQKDLIEALPEVIYHLESFDAMLVRSSIMSFILLKEARKDVSYFLFGDGADELFGGYRYIKEMNHEAIASEIVSLTGSLHNTALQRVDRCASAHGLTPLLAFLTPNVVKLALRIPARYKVYKGKGNWILREAMRDYLPDEILMRTGSRSLQDTETSEIITELTENSISDKEFKKERKLPNGWTLDSKEELFYYRIFRMYFGEFENLSWMGRTKSTSRGDNA
jgi:asparagine synthase (glutamine-hydrolysing)